MARRAVPNDVGLGVKTHTSYHTFNTKKRQEIIDVTALVEECRASAGHEVLVPVTKGKLDFGPWQRVFYGEWDGQRPKRVLFKAMGE